MKTVSATDYHDIVQVGDPQIAPDGERVAFVRKVPKDDESYEATVYVVPVGGDEPRQFTVSEGVDSQPRWSPSGDRLAFVSTRGADDDRPQLWVMPTRGGEARQVTDVVGGVAEIAWSPDGTRIAFTQSTTAEDREEGRDRSLDGEEYEPEPPDPRVIDRKVYRAGQQYLDGRRSHVYVANLEEDEVERLTDGDYDHSTPEWGDAETLYYGVKRTGDPDDNIVIDVVAYDLETGETEDVTRTTGWTAMLAATSDGRLAYAYTPEDHATLRQTGIEVLDRETGEVTTPTAVLDRTLAVSVSPPWGTVPPQWGPNEEDLFFVTPDEGTYTLWRAPGDASADPESVVDEGGVYGMSVGESAAAFVRSEWDHPGDVFATTLRGAETRRLTRVNADYLEDRAVSQPEEVRFEGGDGAEIQGWVLTPPDFDGAAWNAADSRAAEPRDPDETYPLAVEIHGGPHSMWTTSGTMWHEFQLLAARGYVVFWSNPRGSTGYGEEFVAALGEGKWGTVAYEDVMAGVDEVVARDYVDEEDAFVTGGSYGGYLTTWIVGHTDRFVAAVSQRGVYELNSFYGSTDAFKLVEWDFDATPLSDPEFLWEQSPAACAGNVETPTLLIHSDDDFRVPVNNAEMLYLLYKKQGVETRLVRYPREGHELSRSGEPGHVVDRLERLVRWFDGYSTHFDAPKALERGDEGLSAGEEDREESGDGAAGDASETPDERVEE
ncbi:MULTISPECIES: alpha/beta hydrolase family protein [Halorussus]|uniref:S9 family peptidase n=1 Tax=Halorussus TaxID=1070314 RepID=UPI00209CFC29|nr:S9 family peptidase [Halorussus vallis]USZ74071.1 S9 family peptidase [Halorussus vallis]